MTLESWLHNDNKLLNVIHLHEVQSALNSNKPSQEEYKNILHMSNQMSYIQIVALFYILHLPYLACVIPMMVTSEWLQWMMLWCCCRLAEESGVVLSNQKDQSSICSWRLLVEWLLHRSWSWLPHSTHWIYVVVNFWFHLNSFSEFWIWNNNNANKRRCTGGGERNTSS